ncbi:hypothetical protein [Chromobacterium paludis]|uniref:Uncharacterized protein n=1 Tax=Chromobacterium paludis TaxID=2605945 RepID=A0A5C1DL49_9NEIS|nr:hypothetical protein [Chromobacterium paludis]QEL56739.1 hypothetical protein FYK34_14805 [Chromobacterium paludis]
MLQKKKDFPLPMAVLNKDKPDYLPDVIWEELQTRLQSWNFWYWRSSHNLLFGENSTKLFALLKRKPDSRQAANGFKQFSDDDYVNWLLTHAWIFSLHIASDRHHDFHRVKEELREVERLSSQLAALLFNLYQYKNALSPGSDILPSVCKQLSSLYPRAVYLNQERGGTAKSFEEIAGYPDEDEAQPEIINQIHETKERIMMMDMRQQLPTPADMLLTIADETRYHIERYERDGLHGFTINGYQPESLHARYIALFDKGLAGR